MTESEARAKQLCVIWMTGITGRTLKSDAMPRYLAEAVLGVINTQQEWDGERVVRALLSPLGIMEATVDEE